MGGAYYGKPKFTSFNDSRLVGVFERTSAATAKFYHLGLAIGIPAIFFILVGMPNGLTIGSSLHRFWPHIVRFRLPKTKTSGQDIRRKRDIRYFQSLVSFITASTIALIVTVACLYRLSTLPDDDPSRKCPINRFPIACVMDEDL